MSDQILPLDLRACAANDPPRIDYVLPALPVGCVGILSGAGGAGKSMWVNQAIYQVAAGQYCDFGLGTVAAPRGDIGRVLVFNLEDPAEILHSRFHAIARHWHPNDGNKKQWIDDLAEFVRVYPLAGHGITLLDQYALETEAARRLVGVCELFKPRLIVIDTLRRAHDADENNNGQMSAVLRWFEVLARRVGAAVLLLHHESKVGLNDPDAGASALRGASAIVDNARWVARLRTMTRSEGEQRGLDTETEEHRQWVKVGLEKSNYGAIPPPVWLHRGPGGVLLRDQAPESPAPRKQGVPHVEF